MSIYIWLYIYVHIWFFRSVDFFSVVESDFKLFCVEFFVLTIFLPIKSPVASAVS